MLSRVAIRRPVATAMILMMVVVVGIFAFINIPQDLFPDIEFPLAMVITTYPNAGPEEIENLITRPLESVLATVEDLDTLFSVSSQGQSVVMIQFNFGTDMDFASLNMREQVSLVSGFLPDGASEPMVLKLDMGAMPIMNVHISGDMPLSQLHREVENNLLTYFERASGVATVNLSGGLTEQIAIEFNPETLFGLELSLQQISQMISAENINLPGGTVARGSTEVIVRTMGEFGSIEDLQNLPVTLRDRSIVRLQDIATIEQRYRERSSISRMNGETSISISITKQSDANTVAVSEAIHRVIRDLESRFPQYTFRVGMDQAEYIGQSLTALSRAALIGGILAMFVVFLFLKSLKTTLVIAISIPVSLLATFAVMEFRGMTLNLITLSALALAIGILIDNSIIVLENIYRTKQTAQDAQEAAEKGSREVFIAVLAATLTTVAVFLPIAMAGGIAELMFSDFSFTVVIALLVSLVVSLTAVPMLCSKLLSRGPSKDYIRVGSRRFRFRLLNQFTRFIDWLTGQYEIAIRGALKRRKRVIVSCILIFILSLGLLGVVGTEMLPSADEGSFSVRVYMPFGTPLHEADIFMTEIEEYVLAIPEVRHASLRIGGGGLEMTGALPATGTLNVSLVSMAQRSRSTDDIIAQVSERFRYAVGADILIEASSTFGMMMGTVDMQVLLKGADLGIIEGIGRDLVAILADHPDVGEVELDVTEGSPEARVIIDRNIAAYYGLTASQLARGLNSALTGTTATQLRVAGEDFDVVLMLPDTYQNSIDNMMQIMVTGATGIPVSVGQVASIEFGNAPSSIDRYNQQRFLMVNIQIDSSDMLGAAARITEVFESYPFPDGYFFAAYGTQEEMINAFIGLFQALIIAIALVYLILAAQFESLVLPFIVTTSIPFAMSGAFLAMFVTGTALSMTSFLGLIMLVGIVINNSILLVTFISQYRATMGRDEALVAAGRTRLRPILMTTLSTCAAMIPISLGIGEGTEVMAPMGISVIGGLIASTIITLIFVPVLFSIIDDNKAKRVLKKERKMERIAALEAKWLEEDRQNAR